MRAKCLHTPRVLVPNGARRKDGSDILQCYECVRLSKHRSYRKRIGYDALFEKQGGGCAFCGQPLVDDNTTHRDHNHKTGKTRGLVHAQCNQMIGGIENAVALVGMHNIIRYLAI